MSLAGKIQSIEETLRALDAHVYEEFVGKQVRFPLSSSPRPITRKVESAKVQGTKIQVCLDKAVDERKFFYACESLLEWVDDQ